MQPGTYQFDFVGTPVTITVPAGWTTFDVHAVDGPDQSYLAFFDVTDVYKDPCQWVDGRLGIGPSVDDLVAGLQTQPGLKRSIPKPLTVDGFTGVELVFTADPTLDFSTCYTGAFAIFVVDQNYQIGMQTPGEESTAWIMDLNGRRGMINFGAKAPMTDATRAQVDGMLASLRFG